MICSFCLSKDRVLCQCTDYAVEGGHAMMNIQCANAACSAELKYLRGGRLYLLERESFQQRNDGVRSLPGHVSVRRYFWLCQSCAEHYTIRRWTERGIELSLRRKPAITALAVIQHDQEWMLPGLVG